MKRRDQPCNCCGKEMSECDCLWDAQICYHCGACRRHCICVGGPRTGAIYCDGDRKGFRVEVH